MTMKKIVRLTKIFGLILLTLISFASCLATEHGEIILPPKTVDFTVEDGYVKFGIEKRRTRFDGGDDSYSKNPTTPNLQDEKFLGPGESYSIIVDQSYDISVVMKSINSSAIVSRFDGDKKITYEIDANDIFGKIVRITYY